MFPALQSRLEQFFSRLAKVPTVWVRWSLVLALGLSSSWQLFQDGENSLINSSYDQLLKARLLAPKVDPSILIVDIDERSLEAMRSDYGRWPWPRETLGASLEWLESKGVKAVVFDILFADQDTLNPLSDRAFAEAVERSNTSYFPVLRLNPKNDAISEIRAGMIPGFSDRIAPGQKTETFAPGVNEEDLGPTIAVVPPIFSSALQTKRLGFHNIYPDPDGVNRIYTLWEDLENFRLYSLPARMGLDFGWSLPDNPRQIIRFPLEPYSYRSISFIDIWELSQSSPEMKQPDWAKDLNGAIVLIGSTAPSLFDVKVTPLSGIHPGVHILANAIDNVKNQGFLSELPLWFKLIQCWALLAFMAWLSTAISITSQRWAILVMPSLFLGLSYLSLQLTPVFLDFTIAASQALLFFSVLSMYFSWRLKHVAAPTGNFLRTTGHECFVVLFHKNDERVKPQAILDQLQSIKSDRLLFQSGWIGYELEKRLGPTLIWLRSTEISIIQEDIETISNTTIVSADLVWFSDVTNVTRDWEDEPAMLEFAWSQVGVAFKNRVK
jgi:CHASE2 domain-containing sensor protein